MRVMKRMSLLAMVLVCCMVFALDALAVEEPQIKLQKRDLSIHEGLPKDLRSIAVFIVDPQGESRYAPTETMLIATINTSSGNVSMTMLQSSLLVEMPMVGRAPLCDAFALGGENLVMKTLNEVFDLNISDWACIDLQRFSSVVDAVDGIHMILTEEDANVLGLPAGEEIAMDLEQTRAFMRLPRTDPATDRQFSVVMQALYQGTEDKSSIIKLTGLLQKVLGSVDTNLGLMDMITMGTKVIGNKEHHKELWLPEVDDLTLITQEPPYRYTTDMEAMKSKLHEFLYVSEKL